MKFNFMNDDIVQSTEEKKLVMNKTISASTDPSEETIKVDYLDKDNELEKGYIKNKEKLSVMFHQQFLFHCSDLKRNRKKKLIIFFLFKSSYK